MKIKGVKFAGVACGIKKNGKNDLGLVVFERPVIACGVFTKNRVKAPSVDITKKRIKKNPIRALMVVSGNACVCVKEANADALRLTSELSKKLGIKEDEIAHAATGVIGVRMPVEKALKGLDAVIEGLDDDYKEFSEAIRTTDAFEKLAKESFLMDGKKINILGIGKGAGMIAPDMATMLMFIFTDAAIGKAALEKAFLPAIDESFNSISVDGDTSTNDMALVFASGMAGNKEIKSGSPGHKLFSERLKKTCIELAKLVVRDGEGATKLIEIKVSGAKTKKDARTIAKTVANSQLVKTAFFGEDPNWGRIMAAIGRAGVKVEAERIDVEIQKMPVVKKGYEAKGFDEKKLRAVLKDKEIKVTIKLNQGKESTRFYTSDLTFDYVRINSSYRT